MSTEESIRNPHSYNLDVMTIVNIDNEGFDIRNIFRQCLIRESIRQNYLTGEVVVVDSIGLLENAKLIGQESIRIKFRHPTAEHEDDTIDKIFRIYKVVDVDRIDQNTQTFKLMFCSPELIESKRIRISQAFHDNPLAIAAKIANDHLKIVSGKPAGDINQEFIPYFEVRDDALEKAAVLIPNWTVFDTMNWLVEQSQDNSFFTGTRYLGNLPPRKISRKLEN